MSFRGFERTTVNRESGTVIGDGLMTRATPMLIDGVPFFPAIEMTYGRALTLATNDLAVQVNMKIRSPIGNQMGVFVHLTPDAARSMAASLLKQAALVEAHIADQAAAAIEAARNAGMPRS